MYTVGADSLIQQLGISYFRELATFGALSDAAICTLLRLGEISHRSKGESRDVSARVTNQFYVILKGDIAYYQHCEGHDVLTRHFRTGEQMAFDVMINMRPVSGVEVAAQDSLILTLTSDQFFQFHLDHPSEFGLLMINLSRELAREIAMLEKVIADSTGWLPQQR
ncbi:MAG: hypothetical protein OIF57_17370 [Marinobacterium sp.]|nr:hypothetical protein [Marinobacterium sp.]